MNPAPTSADHLSSVGSVCCLTETEGQSLLNGKAVASIPWLVALDEGDSLLFARAAAENLVGEGKSVQPLMAPHTTAQHRPPASNRAASTGSSSKLPKAAFDIPSFLHAQFFAEHSKPNTLPHYDLSPASSPSSAKVTPESETTAEILEDLRVLATWPRLRDVTLPEPVVGGLDLDPSGTLDRLGVKGLSVYTAFIERESHRCRVCGVPSSEMALALQHQRHERHFQRQ